MYLMFGDEADQDAVKGKKFFVYGAIFVPTNSLHALHSEVERLRVAAGLVGTDSLKSATRGRPACLNAEEHRKLKNDVMKAAREQGNVRFCAQVTLHELARNQHHDDLVLFGANTILGKFNTFLRDQTSYGYAIMDRIPVKTPYEYLKEKFQIGMRFPDKPAARFDRILGFSHSADGTSHLCSVADILLGAFRYCVNEPDNEDAGKAMFPTLMEMMWKRTHAGQTYVNECGLVLRPQEVQVAKYKAEYDGLVTRLQGYLGS
ncbi:hypothetical protein AB7M63_007212 [Bradyrhizobium japonicum]